MKINRIENMNLDNVAIKNELTEAEFDILKDALKTLIKAYAFFELDKEWDNDKLFVRDYGSEHQAVHIAGYEEEDGILIGDYFVRAAYLTEKNQVIIVASPVRPIDAQNLLVDTDVDYFLATNLDAGIVTPALYDCFVNDIPSETVTI